VIAFGVKIALGNGSLIILTRCAMDKYLIPKLLVFIFTLVQAQTVHGQSARVNGKIVDMKTGEGIAFAHIVIEDTKILAISDLYGQYVLDVPAPYRNSHLKVSCVGYKSVRIPLNGRAQAGLHIPLEQDVVELREVVVKPENPVNLMKEAFRRIPENYNTSTTMFSGYYKTTSLLQDKNAQYIEAFVDIFKPPYNAFPEYKTPPGDSILVRHMRTRPGEISDWKVNAMLPWEKTIYLLENRDVVKEFGLKRNSFDKFMASYEFDIENFVMINGRSTYMIRLIPRKHKKFAYWNGHIYIDEETKAFVKIDLVSTSKLFRQLKADLGYIILSRLYKVNYDKGEWKESIMYERIGNKWYFKEVNSSKHFLISSRKRNMESVPAYVMLHYRTDSTKSDVVMADSIDFLPNKWYHIPGHLYDSSFWTAFDRQQGIVTEHAPYRHANKVGNDAEQYTFTRLDTLQGALTPLRTCFDVGFYHLDVEAMPEEEIIKGSSLIRFRVTQPTDRIQVDLYSGMRIDSIVYHGMKLNFDREYNAVYVNFPGTLSVGAVEDIKVFFSGRPVDLDLKIPMYASFLWAEDEEGNPWAQAICQGYGASGWWPNKDHLSDEPDSAAISVTVPNELEVVANGRLRAKIQLASGNTRYDWFITYPVNNYNITLNVGKYANFGDKYVDGPDTLDLDYYVLPYNLESARRKTAVVKPMLKTYEKYFGKYPFPNDGYKLVETPHAMEHQSCVAIGPEYFRESETFDFETNNPDLGDGYLDFQIVLHETAHEWWGNNVSCTDNAELWIHEAFATYAEVLFVEDHYGYENSLAYLNAMKKSVHNKYPVIGKFNVNHIHYDINDMYGKGALILNTMRHVINNDSLWFAVLKGIQSTFKYKIATTEDIVGYINQKTKTNYTYIFDQYLRFPKIPVLELMFESIAGKNYVNYRWVTDRDGYTMPVKYKVDSSEGYFLYPTNTWQKTEVPGAEEDTFQVDTDRFYITVKVVDTFGH
jgi:hypothetical protein